MLRLKEFPWKVKVTSLFFYGEELLAPRPTPKLEDHPLSVGQGAVENIWSEEK
jgi:hypothetical protein